MKALYPEWDRFVCRLVHELGIDAYHVTPDTTKCDSLGKITDYWDENERLLIYTGASEKTIHGSNIANWDFRAWHDYVHILFQLPFTPNGESRVCHLQQEQMKLFIPRFETRKLFSKILDCEINGQIGYQRMHGQFPADQRAFALEYMK